MAPSFFIHETWCLPTRPAGYSSPNPFLWLSSANGHNLWLYNLLPWPRNLCSFTSCCDGDHTWSITQECLPAPWLAYISNIVQVLVMSPTDQLQDQMVLLRPLPPHCTVSCSSRCPGCIYPLCLHLEQGLVISTSLTQPCRNFPFCS